MITIFCCIGLVVGIGVLRWRKDEFTAGLKFLFRIAISGVGLLFLGSKILINVGYIITIPYFCHVNQSN